MAPVYYKPSYKPLVGDEVYLSFFSKSYYHASIRCTVCYVDYDHILLIDETGIKHITTPVNLMFIRNSKKGVVTYYNNIQ